MVWENVRFRLAHKSSAKLERLLAAVDATHVNGGALLACFEPEDRSAFLDALHGSQYNAGRLFAAFSTSPTVAAALPALEIPAPPQRPPEFRSTVALAMEGELTHLLLAGGAYASFQGGVAAARQISREFMEELVEDRWLQALVGVSHAPWTTWFCDVAWDSTFVLVDCQACRLWLLCITDTD